jgi:hypothetical protein
VFLPKIAELLGLLRQWDRDGAEVKDTGEVDNQGHKTVLWFHDKSIFYANDCCNVCWVHANETATPKPKGESVSLMIADFVSANHGWLRSQSV